MLKKITRLSLWLLPAALLLAGCAVDALSFTPNYEYVPGGDAAKGQQTIVDYGCGSCHVIPGVRSADGAVGPPLTQWADRVYIAGSLSNQPQNLILWLTDPQTVEPGTAMPDLGVTEEDARHISAYLYTLR